MASDPEPLAGCDVLLLEDEPALRRRLAAHLRLIGSSVVEVATVAEARRALCGPSFDFALIDMHLPDGDALELLRTGAFSETTGVVVMTAFGGIKLAVEALRHGAGDYLSKPFEPEELAIAFMRCRDRRGVQRRDEFRASPIAGTASGELFFGRSLEPVRTKLEAIVASDQRLGRHPPPVLIEGETGTGKSAFASWLHRHGPRGTSPFVRLVCAALPELLAESELFGHERGAFTDARTARIGLMEAAQGGTLFLDDVGTLPLSVQAKLLSAVEEHRIRRLGSTKEISIDIRLIAASNEPLADLVAEGSFREDLYHRLRLLHIVLPPLRERGSDLLPLARHLLEGICRRHRLAGVTLSPAGEARLQGQAWPGNARELAHVIESEVIFHRGPVLDFASLGEPPPVSAASWRNPAWRIPDEGFSIDAMISDLIDEALRETRHNVSAAARRLGVTREFLRYRLAGRNSALPDPDPKA
ncbi:MAG TPA: sigma-54 dependent transcriptional regulator [Opitutaceae bacterium]|jgi:DNA-binding NtrC family response regulator